MKNLPIAGITSLLATLSGCYDIPSLSRQESSRPNIVFIFCDDLGYGDVGCFGAANILTPNIDQLAANGLKFTSFYSLSPVCSPSRAGLLTGRYPVRTGVTAVLFPESWTGLPQEEFTMAEMLKAEGYATGITGKWHLGHHHQHLPLQHGFDEYFGIPYSNDMEGLVYLRNNEVETPEVDQRFLTQRITAEALDFIDRHRDQPFFLYIPHVMPHVPLYVSPGFEGKSSRGLYGDVVEELDWSVGQIISGLNELNLLENTIVVFTSDNGPWNGLREMGGSAGALRDGKFRTYEGGMRVPAVVMWKNRISPGSEYSGLASMADWFPTFAAATGAILPGSLVLDGENILPLMTANGGRIGDEFIYFSPSGPEAYRKGQWKVKKAFAGHNGSINMLKAEPHGDVLFDVENDPGETKDLSSYHPEIFERMMLRMDSAVQALGELPKPNRTRIPADKSHEKYIREKYNLN
jgi:arylsulfatase A